MKLNLINIETEDKEVIISYDYSKNCYEIGYLDKNSLELEIVRR